MASIRNAKKDIEHVTYLVVHDCMAHLEIADEHTYQEVVKVLTNSVQKRNELFAKVNNLPKADKKTTRSYYRNIYKDLLDSSHQSFEQLSQIIGQKK